VDNVETEWAPRAGLVVLAWVAAAIAVVWLLFLDDAPGRLIAGTATLGLALAAAFGTVARPRLAVDDQRIAVRSLFGTRQWPWRQVRRVRVVRHRRLGRDIPMLELDVLDEVDPTEPDGTVERLIVLGRLDLNADPDDVLESIQHARGLT
jgi:hypothetical protein